MRLVYSEASILGFNVNCLFSTLGARNSIYNLSRTIAPPGIYELDDVRKRVLLQLLGGTNKTVENGGAYGKGKINVLLWGSFKIEISASSIRRGIHTSTTGSSVVGLAAYITRDPETRQLVLESGTLVLSAGRQCVCCIDEFDKHV
jgi:DNA replication licensing factor MCM4